MRKCIFDNKNAYLKNEYIFDNKTFQLWLFKHIWKYFIKSWHQELSRKLTWENFGFNGIFYFFTSIYGTLGISVDTAATFKYKGSLKWISELYLGHCHT